MTHALPLKGVPVCRDSYAAPESNGTDTFSRSAGKCYASVRKSQRSLSAIPPHREDLKQASSTADAAAAVEIVENWHSRSAIGNSNRGTVEKTSTLTGAQAHMDAQATGDTDIDVIVNGSNRVTFAGKVGATTRKIVQRLELNQSWSTALTALHEQVEADWKIGLDTGVFTLDGTRQAHRRHRSRTRSGEGQDRRAPRPL